MGLDLHRIPPGIDLDLAHVSTNDTFPAAGGRKTTRTATRILTSQLSELQQLLWATGQEKLLVVLQGIDASGKGGVIKHVFYKTNPSGVKVTSFRVPTPDERARDYLWRVHDHVPAAGEIGIFDRSHYEDVLAARVVGNLPEQKWLERFEHIRAFEKMLTDEGTTIVKVFLHISKEEQERRLVKRLNNYKKHWKFSLSDLHTRHRWDEYQQVFAETINQTNTDHAPWYVVPADYKWYRNWAVANIVVQTLQNMTLYWPRLDEQVLEAISKGEILRLPDGRLALPSD